MELIRSPLARCGSGGLTEASRGWLKHTIVAMPGIAVALLPKLACPLCRPADTALLSALELGFLLTSTVLFWPLACFC